MTLNKDVVTLVSHARESIEEFANTYHRGGAWGIGLTGYCGIASRFLIALARRNNIYGMKLVCGLFDNAGIPETHCWVEFNKFCIDLTISQFYGFSFVPFRICTVGDDFYRKHYKREMTGSAAVRYQKQWKHGQNYESCSTILWRIHKNNHIREYNGLVLR